MTTRDDVLSALRSAGGRGVSGEALAGELGVSRVAVGKHVAALRRAGYEIAASPGSGYRLLSSPDAPLPGEVAPLLASHGSSSFWTRLEGGGETGSTNDDARALARSGAPEGTVVLASRQSAGRGRLGRAWTSPRGGAYMSAVLRPAVAPAQVASLALAVGVGVARGLRALGADSVRLKWPNDVLLGHGKVAGVLLEMAAEADRVEWVVLGVGLNIRRPAEEEPSAERAAYVADGLPDARVPVVVAAVLDGIASAYDEWRAGGFAALHREYESRSALRGQAVTVRDLAGAILASGDVLGVDDDGRLLVRGADAAVRSVVAGEVTLRGPAG